MSKFATKRRTWREIKRELKNAAINGGEVQKTLYGQYEKLVEITSWVLVADEVAYKKSAKEQAKHQVLRMAQCEEFRHLHCVGTGFVEGF